MFYSGVIIDTSSLISLKYINEWPWIKKKYGNLYVAQLLLDNDKLEPKELKLVSSHFTIIDIENISELTYFETLSKSGSLSIADRATITLAKHKNLTCICDDLEMSKVCKKDNIPHIWTLDLIFEMNKQGFKDKNSCLILKDKLINDRGIHLSNKVIEKWVKLLK